MQELEQRVKEFKDDTDLIVQSATLDKRDPEPWIVVMHKGDELSMSVENWKALVKMTDELIK
ncbi:MAG: hypothetical protein RSE15_00705 [Flavobacterium sp.]|uniref:hypothetical protein n=1 Tax=Flavobacterium sp. TaxID=239 RepID=UPI002B46B9E1|nr:hypothetical protein [Flavobacterium sp.]WRH73367.1 MAG: hypothetical protein RSE15_00705 [Flavobacterium sp.]